MARHARNRPGPSLYQRVAALRRHFVLADTRSSLAAIAELDLSLIQGLALLLLDDLGSLGVGELQDQIGRSQAATSHLVEQLERRGFVHRRTDAADGRRRLVELTTPGRRMLGEIEATRRSAVEATFARVPAEVSDRFGEALAEVLSYLDEGSAG